MFIFKFSLTLEAKVEKKEPEVKINYKQSREGKDGKGYKGRYYNENKAKSYAGYRNRAERTDQSEKDQPQEVAEETQEQQVDQDNYGSYNRNYDRDYNNNYYSNNYYSYRGGYNSYRGRGRGYYNPRMRGGQRGRSQRYRNYYNEDSLFEREIHLDRQGENAENLENVGELKHEVEEPEIENENFIDEPVKEEEEEKISATAHTGLISPKKETVSHAIQHDDDANLFNNKDIPSNIRSNIKNLFDENDSHEQSAKSHTATTQVHTQHSQSPINKQHTPHATHVSHTTHSTLTHETSTHPQITQQDKHTHISQQSQLQHQSQLNTQHQIHSQKPKRFHEEFSVSSSSMSIGTPSNKQGNKIIPQSQPGMSTLGTNTVNTPYQNTSFTHQGVQGQVKKPVNQVSSVGSVNVGSNPSSSGSTPNPQVKGVKKNEPTGTEYPMTAPYMPPWGMSPMGFYMPPQGGMGYDPSQMGNNQMYPMMPMYYFPGYGYPQGEVDENMMKNKKNTNVSR
jgi:hypothetical protein